MSRPVLVGYDPRRGDHAPVEFGVATARLTGAPVIVASVQVGAPALPVSGGPVQYAIGQVDEDLVADCTEALEQVEARLRVAGIPVDCRKLRSTSAARALHEEAEQANAGLLVVGSSKRSALGRVLAGSTAERLLQGAPCPVTVVPQGWTEGDGWHVIGVAYVNTEEGREALRSAHALARRAGATLRVVTVVRVTLEMHLETEPYVAGQFGKDLEDVEGEHRLRAEEEARSAVAELDGDVPVEIDAFIGDPAETLARVSEQLDLLVCGSRSYGPVRAVLLGSVARRVTSEARCPVTVLPRRTRVSLVSLAAEAPGAAAPA